jgi:hypothetical protein
LVEAYYRPKRHEAQVATCLLSYIYTIALQPARPFDVLCKCCVWVDCDALVSDVYRSVSAGQNFPPLPGNVHPVWLLDVVR